MVFPPTFRRGLGGFGRVLSIQPLDRSLGEYFLREAVPADDLEWSAAVALA
jgi:hypothetical protein